MTILEFSDEFDVQYNNVMSNQAPGLDEYEKSVFLTKALNQLIKDYFNPKGNKYQEGFDGSNKRLYDFSSLIRTEKLFNVSLHIDDTEKIDTRSIPFLFPLNYFLAINEIITDGNGNKYSVLPISYELYAINMLKPYQLPVKRLAWRMFTDKKNFNYGLAFISYNTSSGVKKAPILIQSSYASDRRLLKFNLKLDTVTSVSSYYIKLTRVRNDYDLEEIDCTVYSNKHLDALELQLDSLKNLIVDAAKKGTPGEAYNGVLIDSKVDVIHWDYFELFDFPNRVKIEEIVPLESSLSNLKLLFSVNTELLYRTIAEIIGKFKDSISSYYLRYVKIPLPIVLEDLVDEGLSILGVNTKTQSELPEELHPEILQRAVELAKSAYQGDLNSTVEMGKRSE